MGAFGDLLVKMQIQDREARFKAKMDIMSRYAITSKDLEDGKWEIREEGPFGETTVKVYKLLEINCVKVEGKVRSVTDIKPEKE